jgi:hypothetical protein
MEIMNSYSPLSSPARHSPGTPRATRNYLAHAILFLVALLLSACSDPIGKLVNEKFPPVSAAQQQQVAISSNAAALSGLPTPNVGLSVSLKDASKYVLTDNLRALGIISLGLTGDTELVHVSAQFEHTFTGEEIALDPTVAKVLSTLHPDVTGRIDVYSGLSGAVSPPGASGAVLSLRLLPGLSGVSITKISVAGHVNAASVVGPIVAALNRYKDNISGELSHQAFAQVNLPVLSSAPIDLARSFSIAGSGTPLAIKILAIPFTPPVRLLGLASSVDKDQLTVLIQLLPETAAQPAQKAPIAATFEALKKQVDDLANEAFGLGPTTGGSWVAVKKELIAVTLNESIKTASICATVAGSAHEQSSSTIPMPDASGIDCTSHRDCQSDRHCEFNASQDNRDCSACLARAPKFCAPRTIFGPGGCTGGQCIQQGQDPICQIAKTAQQTAYNLDANARKADCDRLKTQETVACQATELGKQALCVAGKTTLAALKRTGNFANLDVTADLHSNNLGVCLNDFSLDPGLEHVALSLGVSGSASADVDMHFTPLDIVGHLACQFPWTEKRSFDAQLVEPNIGITSAINIDTGGTTPVLHFAIDDTTIKARLHPGPTEFLVTSPNMLISCAGLDLLLPLTVSLTPFIPQLQGTVDYTVKKQDLSLDVAVPQLRIADAPISLVVQANPKAIVLATATR